MNYTNFFEKAKFNFSWEIPITIRLFEKDFPIVASADAYYATENVTAEQNNSFKLFMENSNEILNHVEDLLIKETGSKKISEERFVPKMIKIKKNGDYAIVFDDKTNIENGIIASIHPTFEIMDIDEYL